MEKRFQRDVRIVREENPELKGAELIVEVLDRDISDRRGLKWEWEKIDPEVMKELKDHWIAIIKEILPDNA